MKKWQGEWTFMNVMHHLHRSSGTETVSAQDERRAHEAIRSAAAKSLFGSTTMSRYVQVGKVTELKGGW